MHYYPAALLKEYSSIYIFALVLVSLCLAHFTEFLLCCGIGFRGLRGGWLDRKGNAEPRGENNLRKWTVIANRMEKGTDGPALKVKLQTAIGSGRCGEVYRGVTQTGLLVAAKRVSPHALDNLKKEVRYERSRHDHPFVSILHFLLYHNPRH